jgi:hypothetical protein
MKLEKMPQPITEPTSAWDVLKRVEALIAEEPKRLNMGTWWDPTFDRIDVNENVPSCGTRGCLAGWTSWVIGYSMFNHVRVVQALGLIEYAYSWGDDHHRPVASELFMPPIIMSTVHPDLAKEYHDLNPIRVMGTREHLDATIDHLHRWMNKNEAFLKEFMVQPHEKSELELRWLKDDPLVDVAQDGTFYEVPAQEPFEEFVSEVDRSEECNCPVCRGISGDDIPDNG